LIKLFLELVVPYVLLEKSVRTGVDDRVTVPKEYVKVLNIYNFYGITYRITSSFNSIKTRTSLYICFYPICTGWGSASIRKI
jgi:hypothetical protein